MTTHEQREQANREAMRRTMELWRAPQPRRSEPDDVLIEWLWELDREATALLNALYDATGATDPDELQAWLDARVGGTDERYSGLIARLRAVLGRLHSLV